MQAANRLKKGLSTASGLTFGAYGHVFNIMTIYKLSNLQLANAARQQPGEDHSTLRIRLGLGRYGAWEH